MCNKSKVKEMYVWLLKCYVRADVIYRKKYEALIFKTTSKSTNFALKLIETPSSSLRLKSSHKSFNVSLGLHWFAIHMQKKKTAKTRQTNPKPFSKDIIKMNSWPKLKTVIIYSLSCCSKPVWFLSSVDHKWMLVTELLNKIKSVCLR